MSQRKLVSASVSAAVMMGLVAFPGLADACTRILWSDNDYAVMVGRTMDWPGTTEPELIVFPRGQARDGGKVRDEVVVPENALKWTSKYGSIVTSVYGIGAADGVNEKGLGAHMLYFVATDFGPRDPSKPGLQVGLLAQYMLDNAASVAEAVELVNTFQPVMVETHGAKATLHLAIEDASGDSAVIEYIDGKAVVYHGRDYKIMTNDPPYDEQLKLLAGQDFSNPTSDVSVPGNVNARDRFQRATYYSSLLPKPASEREAAASILSVTRNVSVPFGAPYKGFGVYNTEYRTAINLNAQRYYFELTNSPNLFWTELSKFNLDAGQPVLTLNPDNIALAGDVAGNFKPAKAPF